MELKLFSLRNVDVLYQKIINLIFQNIINHTKRSIVMISKLKPTHLDDLYDVFRHITGHNIKKNLLKYNFSLRASNFLGFLVHQKVIEIKIKHGQSCNLTFLSYKKIENFFSKINHLNRFIINIKRKIMPFTK